MYWNIFQLKKCKEGKFSWHNFKQLVTFPISSILCQHSKFNYLGKSLHSPISALILWHSNHKVTHFFPMGKAWTSLWMFKSHWCTLVRSQFLFFFPTCIYFLCGNVIRMNTKDDHIVSNLARFGILAQWSFLCWHLEEVLFFLIHQ